MLWCSLMVLQNSMAMRFCIYADKRSFSIIVLRHAVFQPKIDAQGIAIYATELVLWIGVFACGGYFNFRPWLMQKTASRRQNNRSNVDERISQGQRQDPSNTVMMNNHSSSTSVFRTPSVHDTITRRTGTTVDAMSMEDVERTG